MNKVLSKKIDEENKLICDDIFRQTGLRVKGIDRFVNTSISYEAAIPVLTKHLYNNYTNNITDRS